MTERGKNALDNGPDHFTVGPSSLHWDGTTLVIDVDEVTVPVPSRLRGQIRFTPNAQQPTSFTLDSTGRHHWWPYAPFGRISATFSGRNLSWEGHGYADSNTGTAALEADFSSWVWSRIEKHDGAVLLYEPYERNGQSLPLAVQVARDGTLTHQKAPPIVHLKKGVWGVPRKVWSTDRDATRLTHVMEDAPFYTRNGIEVMLGNETCAAVHENLDLDRFASRWVKFLLPFRMPRRARWQGR